MQLSEHHVDDRLVLDANGRFFEIPADLLQQFRISEERLHRIVSGLPRDEAGKLQIPPWLEEVLENLDPDVEAQGRLLDVAAVVVLAAAGCAAPVGTPSSSSDELVSIDSSAVEHRAPDVGTDIPATLRWEREPGDVRPSELECVAFENGGYAPARARITDTGTGSVVWEGACGAEPAVLGEGAYEVAITLDLALDRPTQHRSVAVDDGQDVTIEAKFETSILEVRIQRDGERAAGIVRVLRDGQLIGTLGSYIPAHISSGEYSLAVSHRTDTETIGPFILTPGQRRAFTVSF